MGGLSICRATLLVQLLCLHVLAKKGGLRMEMLSVDDGNGNHVSAQARLARSNGQLLHQGRGRFPPGTSLWRAPRHPSWSLLQEDHALTARRVQAHIAKTIQSHAAQSQAYDEEIRSSKVLYIVYTGSQFYSTRAKWIMDTWGNRLQATDLVFIGDKPPTEMDKKALRGATVHLTGCRPHSHEEGMCCKLAEAALLANKLMQLSGAFEWSYLVDDDAYVRPDAMGNYLAQQSHADSGGLVFGLFGCTTNKCHDGLCGGGGYAADTAAMAALVGDNATAFLTEEMQNCKTCDGWADMALSTIFQDRGLETRHLSGANGWRLKKPCFDKELVDATSGEEPLMYHYIKTEAQMKLLDALFTAHGTTVPSPPDEQNRCAAYLGNVQCAESMKTENLPWDVTSSSSC
mmetsp:Transcript_100326/g.259479  ORF Transcript_100326/g.259479 Transcript_100326/m.259479 type:complete len:402 (+) Transcript_100326:41-1246(+)